jgi:hypothetical protein
MGMRLPVHGRRETRDRLLGESMTTTETQQLTIARAIAYEIERHTGEPGWATESMGRIVGSEYSPRPLTTLADARAAWVASGGDPERGPALEFRSVDLEWLISDNAEWVHTRSGRLWASCRAPEAWEWTGIGTTEDAALLARIIRAVEEVTRAA